MYLNKTRKFMNYLRRKDRSVQIVLNEEEEEEEEEPTRCHFVLYYTYERIYVVLH
jgi:hypothetical protein